MPVLIGLAVVLLIFIFTAVSSRQKSIKEGTWLGTRGMEAMFLWNSSSPEKRKLLLAAVDVLDGAYRDGLLEKTWADIPPMVQISLAQTLEEMRHES